MYDLMISYLFITKQARLTEAQSSASANHGGGTGSQFLRLGTIALGRDALYTLLLQPVAEGVLPPPKYQIDVQTVDTVQVGLKRLGAL
jgi:hypothetical protein